MTWWGAGEVLILMVSAVAMTEALTQTVRSQRRYFRVRRQAANGRVVLARVQARLDGSILLVQGLLSLLSAFSLWHQGRLEVVAETFPRWWVYPALRMAAQLVLLVASLLDVRDRRWLWDHDHV